jgi:hypothetical protein
MERQKFEDAWKDAFSGSELEPSDNVWTNVELELEKEAGGKMKRRLLFFQLLAAASMVFAMGVGGIYFLNQPGAENPDGEMLALQNPASTSEAKRASKPEADSNQASSANEQSSLSSEEINNSKANQATLNPQTGLRDDSQRAGKNRTTDESDGMKASIALASQFSTSETGSDTPSSPSSGSGQSKSYAALYSARRSDLVTFRNPKLEVKKDELNEGEKLLARLEAERKMLEEKHDDKKRKKSDEQLWTSVGFGAGTFDPNPVGSPGTNAGLAASGKPVTPDPTEGSSYSASVQVGARVANRFVILGGVSYLSQNSGYTSSTIDGDGASLSFLSESFNKRSITPTSPYKVNSNIQYLSIPVQAGYVLLDRTFAIQLNGGVSTDFFIQNTLTPENSRVEKTTQGPGSDSPFRPVNFSGLVGTELSYRIANRYRVALNPSMRYALNSIYKSNIDTEIAPVTFDVSLRFRYIFK